MNPSRRLSQQRGLSVFSMFIVAVVVGFFALMAIRSFPAINEYLTIKRTINRIMKDGPASAQDIRTAFSRQTDVEYSITTLKASDLEITQVGDRLRCRYHYDKEVEILDPVYLLFKFDGAAMSGGNGP